MFPDIAIIADDKIPVLVSYLDLKTDLGYKRTYFEAFESIKTHVLRLRNVAATNTKTWENNPRDVVISKEIKWRTVVISDCNISPRSLLQKNKECAIKYQDYFNLYFLSGKCHPNEKRREKINIYEEKPFNELIDDLKNEIRAALPLVKGEEIEIPTT
jgi:hypothetical protein